MKLCSMVIGAIPSP